MGSLCGQPLVLNLMRTKGIGIAHARMVNFQGFPKAKTEVIARNKSKARVGLN